MLEKISNLIKFVSSVIYAYNKLNQLKKIIQKHLSAHLFKQSESKSSPKTIKNITLNNIVESNKNKSHQNTERKLFAPGELHIICAQTGIGKSILSVEIGLAIAGGKDSPYHKEVSKIFNGKWNFAKQKVNYIDGENGEDELYNRYGKAGESYPPLFNITPAGTLNSIEKLENYIQQYSNQSKNKEDLTIIIDHPDCYEGHENHYRMGKFYNKLKDITLEYNKSGHYLTIIILKFIKNSKHYQTINSTDIKGSKNLIQTAHTIVALGKCSLGEDYRYLKILKCRSVQINSSVSILKTNNEYGLFFNYVNEMEEAQALPAPVKPQKNALISITPSQIFISTNKITKTINNKHDKRRKVTQEVLSRIKQLYNEGKTQQYIADLLQLCRKYPKLAS